MGKKTTVIEIFKKCPEGINQLRDSRNIEESLQCVSDEDSDEEEDIHVTDDINIDWDSSDVSWCDTDESNWYNAWLFIIHPHYNNAFYYHYVVLLVLNDLWS